MAWQEQPKQQRAGAERVGVEVDQTHSAGRPWRAVRVDLVVSPISQFAFALLGWTGSKVGLNGFLAILVGVKFSFVSPFRFSTRCILQQE